MVDASVVLEVLLLTPVGVEMGNRLFAENVTLHAPYLLDLEVAQVLRRYCLAGELRPERGMDALQDLIDLPVTRYPHQLFLPRIWELRHNVTAYDAVYLALAETLRAPLLTRDNKLAASSGHSVVVEVVR